MRRRDEALSMSSIAEIRGIQLVAAEAAALRARRQLGDIERERDEEERRLGAEQQCWAEAVGGSAFSPELATVWASAVVRREAGLRALDERMVEGGEAVERCRADWRSADLKARAADEKARMTARRAARVQIGRAHV